ncbi:MAG: hypothetical protein AMJ43_05480 [Coxiella sp. DG_40]|nr:MAG: hypothetical protein AMJ43_05480 [Coxiella sp. DG_40]
MDLCCSKENDGMIQNSIKITKCLLFISLLLSGCTPRFWQPAIWDGTTNYVNRIGTITEHYTFTYRNGARKLSSSQVETLYRIVNKNHNVQAVFVSSCISACPCLNEKNRFLIDSRLNNVVDLIRERGFNPVITRPMRNKCYDNRLCVNLSVKRRVVIPPVCPGTSSESNYYHIDERFGCATVHNLGAMIANPDDLHARPSINPFSGERAASTIIRYRGGK